MDTEYLLNNPQVFAAMVFAASMVIPVCLSLVKGAVAVTKLAMSFQKKLSESEVRELQAQLTAALRRAEEAEQKNRELIANDSKRVTDRRSKR